MKKHGSDFEMGRSIGRMEKIALATELLAALPFEDVCTVVASHLEARPDVQCERLEDLGNKIGRIGHMAGRSRR